MQEEYAAWLEALPEATRDGEMGEALQAIVALNLDELLAIEPPRGFGRDEGGSSPSPSGAGTPWGTSRHARG